MKQELVNLKNMQIKSWQIALVGVIPFGLAILLFINELFDFIYILISGIIILFLLYFEKTRKIGAILSLAFGLFGIIFIDNTGSEFQYLLSERIINFSETSLIFFATESLLILSLLIAGIHYFWKKV